MRCPCRDCGEDARREVRERFGTLTCHIDECPYGWKEYSEWFGRIKEKRDKDAVTDSDYHTYMIEAVAKSRRRRGI